FNHVAVTALAPGNGHAPGGCCAHWFARFTAQIDAGMDGGPAQKWVHAHAEWRTHVDLTDDRLAHRHSDQCVRVAVDLRARDIYAVKLTFEGTGTGLWWFDWNERATDGSVASRSDRINPEICEHASHAAGLRIDTLFKIREGGRLRLLDFIQR